MTVFFYILAAALAAGGAYMLLTAWPHVATSTDIKDYISFIQIVSVFITAIVVAILGAVFGRSNEKLKADLAVSVSTAIENLRSRLAEETGTKLESLRSTLAQSVAESTEKLKAELAKSTDEHKLKLAKRHDAYNALWAAATVYFSVLQHYQTNEYRETALIRADKGCSSAIGQTLLVDQDDVDAFYDFYQAATALREKGKHREGTPSGLEALWMSEGRALGENFLKLKEKLAASLV